MIKSSPRAREERAKKLARRLNANMWAWALPSVIVVALIAWFLFAR
jgi:hypothetical protein